MIERSIVQYWNTSKLPDDIRILSDTWKHENIDDGFDHTVYSRDSTAEFLRDEYGSELSSLFLTVRLPAMQSDIFRLAYCHSKGGVYIDIGSRCHKSIKPLLISSKGLTLMRKWHGGIWNGLIISETQNTVLEHIFEAVISNLKNRSHSSVWQITGPANYIRIAEKNEFKECISVVEQSEVHSIFELVGNEERKGDQHWSNLEKTIDLYRDGDLDVERI